MVEINTLTTYHATLTIGRGCQRRQSPHFNFYPPLNLLVNSTCFAILFNNVKESVRQIDLRDIKQGEAKPRQSKQANM